VGGEMMIEAAAESVAHKAIVSEGGSGRPVRDALANPGTRGKQWSAMVLPPQRRLSLRATRLRPT
jgi:hypothetical protein